MSKYIHVNGDDGSMVVKDHQMDVITGEDEGWFQEGWIYKVPDDFEIIIPLDKLEDSPDVYVLVGNHPDSELVFTGS